MVIVPGIGLEAALAAVVQVLFDPASQLMPIPQSSEPKWRPVTSSETSFLNRYIEDIQKTQASSGDTDEFELERIGRCGPERAQRFAEAAGLAQMFPGGYDANDLDSPVEAPDPGEGCLSAAMTADGINIDAFLNAFNSGFDASEAIKAGTKGSQNALLFNVRVSSADPEWPKGRPIKEAIKLQRRVENEAIKLALSKSPSKAEKNLLAFWLLNLPTPPGISAANMAKIRFVRSKGVGKKKALHLLNQLSVDEAASEAPKIPKTARKIPQVTRNMNMLAAPRRWGLIHAATAVALAAIIYVAGRGKSSA